MDESYKSSRIWRSLESLFFPLVLKISLLFSRFSAIRIFSKLERQILSLLIMDPEMSQEYIERKVKEMYESGALSLENVAIANEPHAFEMIQNLISSGLNPLVPNSRKLFPYHFAQSLEIFDALTPPPIQRQSYLLTLAR